jgi:FRG domain
LFDMLKRRQAAAAVQSGEAELKRYLQFQDAQALDRAIEQLRQGAERLPDSDAGKISCMLTLGAAYALRFGDRNDRGDFHAAVSWNEHARAASTDDASKAQALFNIGALQSEEHKRSGELGPLEAAVDSFIQSLQLSGPEHRVRKLLITGLQGTLSELTLKTPDAAQTADRWYKAINAVPFRSLDQKALQTAWHAAFGYRAQIDNPPPPVPSFLEMNRARLRAHASANEAAELRAASSRTTELREIDSYAELRQAIENLHTKFPGALLVFRGQVDFHDGRLAPSMARKTAQDGEATRLLWIAAVAENIRYGEPDPLTRMMRDLNDWVGVAMPPEPDERFWKEIDPAGPAMEAILQHYGARTHFIDVSTSLEVALWFAHFRFRMRRDIYSLEDLAARGTHWEEDAAAPEYDIAWYEPAWAATEPVCGYLFVVAPRLPQSGETLAHGEYIDLTPCPSPRMQAQHAGLIYIDSQKEQGARALAVFKFRLPLADAPAEALDPSVTRLFPAPDEDPLYGQILWSTPFWPSVERPAVQVRRLRIPEYHSAPAARPDTKDWADWTPFRARDAYTYPGFVFPRLAKEPWVSGCEIAGRQFILSNARPLVPAVPSVMIEAPIPEPGARLDLLGRSEVFLEYDPLSRSLSPRAEANHITTQIDRRHGEIRGSYVPLPGVRGAWVIQAGDLYWCRVYTQREDGVLASTAGRAFGFDRQFGWIVKEGRDTVTLSEAVDMRAERAALYLVLGISERVAAGAWCVTETPGSPYFRLSMVRE